MDDVIVDPRKRWLLQKVCLLLFQDDTFEAIQVICPLKPTFDPDTILRRFMDDLPCNSLMFLYSPSPHHVRRESSVRLKDPPTAMGAYHWEADADTDDTSEGPLACPIIHIIEGLPWEDLGQPGILLRKSIKGSVESSEDDAALNDILPLSLQMTYVQKNYRDSFCKLFKDVYLPIVERFEKYDSASYLKLLASGFIKMTEISARDSPFANFPQAKSRTRGLLKGKGSKKSVSIEAPSGGEEERQGEEGEEGEEGGSSSKKDSKEQILKDLMKIRNTYTKEQGENTLTELRETWEKNYNRLSGTLAFAMAHPIISTIDEITREKKEFESEQHKGLFKGHRTHDGKEREEHWDKGKEEKDKEDKKSDSDTGVSKQKEEEVKREEDQSTEKMESGEKGENKDEGKDKTETKEKKDERQSYMDTKKALKMKRKALGMRADDEKYSQKVKDALANLVRLHTELGDCHRSLFYLESCLKVVEEGKVEELGGKSLELLKTLEIVWRVGRREGISGRVQIILEASIQSLVDVVTRELRPVNLLPSSMKDYQPLLAAQSRVNKAVDVVTEWEQTLSTYATIILRSDKRLKDGRFDFDPRKVMGSIQDLKSVCEDLQDILKDLLEVHVVLSPEWCILITPKDSEKLKTVTSQVLKVLTSYDFNIFSPRNKDRWIRQKKDFKRCVQEWEQATEAAITESFKDRLTSELVSAIEIVLKKEPCRPIFRQLLLSQLPSLMSAFDEEVKGIVHDFEVQINMDQPGCQAPVAGKVRWMSAYLNKRLAAWSVLKKLYTTHMDDPASLSRVQEIGASVEEVRKEVEKARSEEVECWRDQVNKEIPRLLVTPVIICKEDKGYQSWEVELPGELQTIVWESGQLVHGGFQPPPLAMHFSLHYPTLLTAAMSLQLTLKDYNNILEILTPIQKEVLRAEIEGAERALETGRRVITWSPASLTHFSKSCKGMIDHVTGIAKKLLNISQRLSDLAETIGETKLMTLSSSSKQEKLLHFQELQLMCEKRRTEHLEHLKEIYGRFVNTLRSTSALLTSSSETCPETLQPYLTASTDVIKRMSPFLNHWKENIQKAITQMIIGTMYNLQKELMTDKSKEGLFEVEADLTPSGTLCLTTPPRNLVSSFSLSLAEIVRSCMVFHNWDIDEQGTVNLDNQLTMDEDTLAASSFYSQISKDKRIHTAISDTQNCFADAIRSADIDLQKWYSYEHIWQRSKEITVKRFCKQNPSVRQFDDKLRFYREIIENLKESQHYSVNHSVRLNLELLIGQIIDHANKWIHIIGSKLKNNARKRLSEITTRVMELEKQLGSRVYNFVSLRLLVNASRQVRSSYAGFTSDLQEIGVMFNILGVYGMEIDEAYLLQTSEILTKTEGLHRASTRAMKRAEGVYSSLERNTLSKLEAFFSEVEKFHEQYQEKGPGAVGNDLDKGLELLKHFGTELTKITDARDNLEIELDIFDLPEIKCKAIDDITSSMKILSDVYYVYKTLKNVEFSWRSLRFSTASFEEIQKELVAVKDKLYTREGVLDTEVGKQFQTKVEKYLLSLEVAACLRQPAIHQRHWQYLMNIIMGPADTIVKEEDLYAREGAFLTLSQVMQLNLSEHSETVTKCVITARKELKIFQQVEEIREFWISAEVDLDTTSSIWELDGIDNLTEVLQHHHLLFKILERSRFATPSKNEIKRILKILMTVDKLLNKWQELHTNIKIVLSPAISSKLPLAEGMMSKYTHFLEVTNRRPFVSELAFKDAYIEKLDRILQESRDMVEGLSAVLYSHRQTCPRLFFLTDHQLASLLSSPQPIQCLETLLHQIFNNIMTLTRKNGDVTGLLSVENEEFEFTKPVKVVEGEYASKGVKSLLEEIKFTTKDYFQKVLLNFKEEDSLTEAILNSSIVSQLETGSMLWWTADMEEAYNLIGKGKRYAFRDVLSRTSENIKSVLGIMGRLFLDQEQSDKPKSLKISSSLSGSRKTWSASGGLSSSGRDILTGEGRASTAGSGSESSGRLQSLLLTLIRCRDVVSLLLKQNSCDSMGFNWQIQPRYYLDDEENLFVRVMHRQIKYGFEYRGIGNEDYILSPNSEATLITLMSTIASYKPALLLGENYCGATGRQSIAEFAAHLSGKFLIRLNVSSQTSQRVLRKIITGCILDGAFLMIRNPEMAPAGAFSFLSSTLLKLHNAHSHPYSPGIIHLGKEDIKISQGVGIILLPSSCTLGNAIQNKQVAKVALQSSLRNLCQRVYVERPSQKSFIYTLLLAHNIPKAYQICNAIHEVIRHFSGPAIGDVYLHPKHLKIVVTNLLPFVDTDPESMADLSVKACGKTLSSFLTGRGDKFLGTILKQLSPSDATSQTAPEEESKDLSLVNIRNEVKRILESMNKLIIEEQVEKVLQLITQLSSGKGKVAVICGPRQSGKTTMIEVACKAISNLSGTFPRRPERKADDSATNADDGSRKRAVGDSDIFDILSNVEEQLIYHIFPQIYDRDQLLGSENRVGLLPCLVKHLNALPTKKERFILLTGKNSGCCLKNVNNFPGSITLDSGMILPLKENISFIIETEELKTVCEWVRSRAIIVQFDDELISPKRILCPPSSDALTSNYDIEGETDVKLLSSRSVPKESKEDGPAKTEMFSITATMDSNSLIFYLLQPFLESLIKEWSMIPFSPLNLVDQTMAIFKGLERVESEKKIAKANIGSSIYCDAICQEILVDNEINFINVICSVMMALTSVTLFAHRGQIDDILRPRIANILLLDSVTESYKQTINDLLAIEANLGNVFWDKDELKWKVFEQEESVLQPLFLELWEPSVKQSMTTSQEELSDGPVEAEEIPPPENQVKTVIEPYKLQVKILRNILTPLLKSNRPLLLIGRKLNKKSRCILTVVESIQDMEVVHIRLTKMTSVKDFENIILKFLNPTAMDVLEPTNPTIIIINHMEYLEENFALLNYIQNLHLCRGIYNPLYNYRWTEIRNVYIIGVLSTTPNSTYEEKQIWSHLNGWAVHVIEIETVSMNFVASFLPFEAYESQLQLSLLKMTFNLMQKIKSLTRTFIELKLWEGDYSTLQRIRSTFQFFEKFFWKEPLEEESENPISLWLITICLEYYYPIIDLQLKGKILELIKEEMNIDPATRSHFTSIEELPRPIWTKCEEVEGINFHVRLETSRNRCSQMIAEDNKKWGAENQVPKEIWHENFIENVSLLSSVLLLETSEVTSPLLLMIGPPSPDVFLLIQLTTKYLDMRLIHCMTSEGANRTLRRHFLHEEKERTVSKDTIIYFTANLLKDEELMKNMSNINAETTYRSVEDKRPRVKVIISATDKDVENFFVHFEYLFRQSVMARMEPFTLRHHVLFAAALLLQIKEEKARKLEEENARKLEEENAKLREEEEKQEISTEEDGQIEEEAEPTKVEEGEEVEVGENENKVENEVGEERVEGEPENEEMKEAQPVDELEHVIGGFLGQVHHSILEFTSRAKWKKTDFRNPSLDFSYPSPSISNIKTTIDVFLNTLSLQLESTNSELNTLKQAVVQNEALHLHMNRIRAKDSDVLQAIIKTQESIRSFKDKIEKNKAKVVEEKNQLESLRNNLVVAKKNERELAEEVSDYEKEKKEPLNKTCEELAQVDMDRVKKLVARSPLTAVQLVFECAVTFLGSPDTTWKAVRPATNNPEFCTNLATIDVPNISKERIEVIIEKLKQVKIADDHMARISDIGYVLLRYLKMAVFFWRRYHEDIKPRRERVNVLKEATEELEEKICSVEKSITDLNIEVKELSVTLEKEEGRLNLLNEDKARLETELNRMENVILELNSHNERWLQKIASVECTLKHLPGICLLESASNRYLPSLPSQIRLEFLAKWKELLVSKQMLMKETLPEKKRRSVLSSVELHEELQAILKHYIVTDTPFFILLRDPHCMMKTYFGSEPTINLESSSWKDTLKNLKLEESTSIVYAQGRHDLAGECLTWWSTISDVEGAKKFPSIVLSLEDGCSYQPCNVCSNQIRIDLSLNDKGMENEFSRIFLQNLGSYGRETNDKLLETTKSYEEIKAKRKRLRDELMTNLIMLSDFDDHKALEKLTREAQALNTIIADEIRIETELETLATVIQNLVQNGSAFGLRVYYGLSVVKALSRDYLMPFDVLSNALGHKVKTTFANLRAMEDVNYISKELIHLVSETVMELYHPKLFYKDRIPFSVVLAMLRIVDSSYYKHLLKAFLLPVEEDEELFKNIFEIEMEEEKKDLKAKEEEEREAAEQEKKGGKKQKLMKHDDNNNIHELLKTFSSSETSDDQTSSVEEEIEDDKDLDFLFKSCKKNMRRTVRGALNGCATLFNHRRESLIKRKVIDFVEGNSNEIFDQNNIDNALLEVILARHLRQDLFLSKAERLFKMALSTSFLQPSEYPLEDGFPHCSFTGSSTKRKQKFLIKMIYSSCLRSDLIIKFTATRQDVKQYKISHISLPSLSLPDLRYEILKASRRKTWLVINDMELIPEGFLKIQRLLNSLPEEAKPPTVLCLYPSCHKEEMTEDYGGVSARIEGCVNFHSALLHFLPKVLPTNVYDDVKHSIVLRALCTASAFVHSIFHTRMHYKDSGWISQISLTEEDFKATIDVLSFLLSQDFCNKSIPWDTIGESLIQVVYRNAIPNKLDLNYANTLVKGYLGHNMLNEVTSGGVLEQDGAEMKQLQVLRSLCGGKTNKDDILKRVCEEEEAILGLKRKEFEKFQILDILESMQAFSESENVFIPRSVVTSVVRLLSRYTSGRFGSWIHTVDRQRDLETTAWENETKYWDETCISTQEHLTILLQAAAARHFSPSQILIYLDNFVDRLMLPSSASNGYSEEALSTYVIREQAKYSTRRNFLQRTFVKTFLKKLMLLFQQLKIRFQQLALWAHQETNPAEVQLGVLRFHAFWLIQFRRAVCVRTHWNLKGSILYAYPPKDLSNGPKTERPPQAVYLTGCSLVGGVWNGSKVLQQNTHEEGRTLILCLAVAHSRPVAMPGQKWIPVLDPVNKEQVLFEVLLPTDQNFIVPQDLLHVRLEVT